MALRSGGDVALEAGRGSGGTRVLVDVALAPEALPDFVLAVGRFDQDALLDQRAQRFGFVQTAAQEGAHRLGSSGVGYGAISFRRFRTAAGSFRHFFRGGLLPRVVPSSDETLLRFLSQ